VTVKTGGYLFAQGSLIALMIEAASTSETSVDIYLTTRQYIPEDSERQAVHTVATAI
jgi:phage tail sheath gpL-like